MRGLLTAPCQQLLVTLIVKVSASNPGVGHFVAGAAAIVYPLIRIRVVGIVLDDRTLLLPDRPGNRQVDTLINLVERPYVGLVFFVPGLAETLRVNGRAEVSIDRALLEPLVIEGTLPISVLRVTVEEAFLHCAKALICARLWEPDVQVERSCFPTYGQVLADQIAAADAAEIDAGEAKSARTELY